MPKKIDYSSMFTLRSDGRYQASVMIDGKRKYIYDRNPEILFKKVQDAAAPKEDVITFGFVAGLWERKHREEIELRTWNNYKPHYEDLLNMYGMHPISEVTANDVQADLMRAKARGYSATVVNTRRSLFRMIFDHAIIQGYIQFNPVSAVKMPKGLHRGKRVAPTEEQMKIILRNVDAPFGLFPFLLLCTGLRKSEALALTWSDIDFGNQEISVTKSLDYIDGSHPRQKTPKTDAGYRTIPILDILLEPLKQAKQSAKSIYVFPSCASPRGGEGGGIMTERGYEGAWQRYAQYVGLVDDKNKPVITAHNLRHGTATLMFELGVDELTAQRILGHSRIEITREIYTDLRAGQKIKSVSKLNDGMSAMMSESL